MSGDKLLQLQSVSLVESFANLYEIFLLAVQCGRNIEGLCWSKLPGQMASSLACCLAERLASSESSENRGETHVLTIISINQSINKSN